MSILDDYIADKIAVADYDDSYAGMTSYNTESKLEKSLYKLFDIEIKE